MTTGEGTVPGEADKVNNSHITVGKESTDHYIKFMK